MKYLSLSLGVLFLGIPHIVLCRSIKDGKVREAFCAGWCLDTLFIICGMLLCFSWNRYELLNIFRLPALLWIITFLGGIVLVIWFAPSGFCLFRKRKEDWNQEETWGREDTLLFAEYRFDATWRMIKKALFGVLFIIPILINLPFIQKYISVVFTGWKPDDLCGNLCFGIEFVLFCIGIRQSVFWIRALSVVPKETEKQLLRQYRFKIFYRTRNRRI